MLVTPKVGDTVKLIYPPRYSDVLECEGRVVLAFADGDFDVELPDGETWTVCHQEQERGVVHVEIPAKGEVTPVGVVVPPGPLPTGAPSWQRGEPLPRGHACCPREQPHPPHRWKLADDLTPMCPGVTSAQALLAGTFGLGTPGEEAMRAHGIATPEVCSHCGGPGPIQVGLCEGCDYARESTESDQLLGRRVGRTPR